MFIASILRDADRDVLAWTVQDVDYGPAGTVMVALTMLILFDAWTEFLLLLSLSVALLRTEQFVFVGSFNSQGHNSVFVITGQVSDP